MTGSDPQTVNEKIMQFIDRIIGGRDIDLTGHHKRVCNSTLALACNVGCEAEELEVITIASRIHDLGKMSINEHTLYKPGRLTDSEFGLVKQHTVIGGHLLEPLGLDSRIQEVVMFHHENFDGTGYPNNLKGEDIPFLARIMRITDSYDALMTDRPYHMGVSSRQALDILSKDSHFYDPYLLKSFRVMAEMGGI